MKKMQEQWESSVKMYEDHLPKENDLQEWEFNEEEEIIILASQYEKIKERKISVKKPKGKEKKELYMEKMRRKTKAFDEIKILKNTNGVEGYF